MLPRSLIKDNGFGSIRTAMWRMPTSQVCFQSERFLATKKDNTRQGEVYRGQRLMSLGKDIFI